MALVSLSAAGKEGVAVIQAGILLPLTGPWTAEIRAASQELLTGKVQLQLGPTHILVGTIMSASVVEGQLRVRLAAGGRSLTKPSSPSTTPPPRWGWCSRIWPRTWARPISARAIRPMLAHQLEHWTTGRMPAGQAVRCLLAKPAEVSWRHLPDGTLWAGRESWPATPVRDAVEVRHFPEDRASELALEDLALMPGTTWQGRRVDYIDMRVTGSGTRATVWYAS